MRPLFPTDFSLWRGDRIVMPLLARVLEGTKGLTVPGHVNIPRDATAQFVALVDDVMQGQDHPYHHFLLSALESGMGKPMAQVVGHRLRERGLELTVQIGETMTVELQRAA